MRESFELIFEEILIDLIKTPTPVKPNPTLPKTQLPPTLCCLAHGCGLSTLEDVFGWFISSNDQTFNLVCRILVHRSMGSWVSAWDGFHVYISSKLKNYFSFKKRYSISNMGLAAFNKRFLHAALGAPGSTHDARRLCHTSLKIFWMGMLFLIRALS